MSTPGLLMHRRTSGFTLIEILCVLVLLGLLGLFGTQMLSTTVEGYTQARNATEVAQKAQMALQRMTIDFTYIAPLHLAGTANTIQYANTGGAIGNHIILQSGNLILYQQGGTNYTLLDGVVPGSLSFTYSDAYTNAGVSTISNNSNITLVGIAFTMQGDDPTLGLSKTFSTRVKINKAQ
ncbi:prepilin-type N-terminal cleavage/methylation domain-containing protein [Solidesulfovibrio sp.]